MRYAWLLLLSVQVATCVACALPSIHAPSRVLPTYASAVIDTDCPTAKWRGSGVVVGRRTVYTAAHVVDCVGTVKVTTSGGGVRTARVVWTDEHRDIAQLAIEGATLPGPYPEIGPKPRTVVCIAAAYPKYAWRCGVVRSVQHGKIRHSARTIHGNSGAGLYDERGRLVGIATHVVFTGGGIAGGIE